MVLNERSKKLVRDVVVHCIEIMGLKNPDSLEKINDSTYKHVSTKGRARVFRVYSRAEYFVEKNIQHKKLHKVMTFLHYGK